MNSNNKKCNLQAHPQKLFLKISIWTENVEDVIVSQKFSCSNFSPLEMFF